ncbi:uncharacterized protein LOC135948193 [Cloeon dipterum]|uniref:uncharacterized protein LOC135948193 n=1 Tax=Cloeon dipterum TaxID=197152 RepID=UPI00321F9FFB
METMEVEDKYGRAASFARKTSRPQLMRALSDFEEKTVRRRYICLGIFILVAVMVSIVIYGIVHAASHMGPQNHLETTTSVEEVAHTHALEVTTILDKEVTESANEENAKPETSSVTHEAKHDSAHEATDSTPEAEGKELSNPTDTSVTAAKSTTQSSPSTSHTTPAEE